MTAPPARIRIAVCDDEHDVRETVAEYLARRGFDVLQAEDGAALERLMAGEEGAERRIEAVLLDIAMPGDDGLTVLRRLRAGPPVAVIMLTAHGDVVDRIVGLELGADDYLVKPVDLRELDARIRAVLRRHDGARGAVRPPTGRSAPGRSLPGPPQVRRLLFDGLTLDLEAATLTGRDGAAVALTAMEFRLLQVFAERPGRVLNRDQLLELAHDRDWDPFDRSIDIRISRLRRKIERNPARPALLRTVRGVGYVFGSER